VCRQRDVTKAPRLFHSSIVSPLVHLVCSSANFILPAKVPCWFTTTNDWPAVGSSSLKGGDVRRELPNIQYSDSDDSCDTLRFRVRLCDHAT